MQPKVVDSLYKTHLIIEQENHKKTTRKLTVKQSNPIPNLLIYRECETFEFMKIHDLN